MPNHMSAPRFRTVLPPLLHGTYLSLVVAAQHPGSSRELADEYKDKLFTDYGVANQ